jgi:hypothetical protein
MTNDAPSVHADLAFLRGLVDEDWRPGVWTFGALYVAVGVALAIHVLLSWADGIGLLPLQPPRLLIAYVVLYGGLSVVIFRNGARGRRLFGTAASTSRSAKGRAGGAALMGAFLAHLVSLGVVVIVAARLGLPQIFELLAPELFILQGVAWIVVHAIRRERWHAIEAWAWFLAALGVAPLIGTSFFGPAVAAVSIALMVVPGVYMMRLARKAA